MWVGQKIPREVGAMLPTESDYKGSVNEWDRQTEKLPLLTDKETDKINAVVRSCVVVFVSVCIVCGLVVGLMRVAAWFGEDVSVSAKVLTNCFDAVSDMLHASIPTALFLGGLFAFIQMRRYYKLTE